MTGDLSPGDRPPRDLPGLDPLAAVRADAAALDALAAGRAGADPVVALLSALRAEIDAAVASGSSPEVRRDAALLDALAAGAGTHQDAALGLLHALRATVDGVTVPAAVAPDADPVRALRAAPAVVPVSAGSRRRRRALRTGVAASSVALALSMSGVAAAAYSSHPGGSLYGLRTQTFGRTNDDPVAAEQVLAALQNQVAVALSTPDDPAVVAQARATAVHFRRLVAAEHNPAVQQSIAASASTVETTLAVLPAAVAPATSTSPHPAARELAGGRSSSRTVKPAASAGVASVSPAAPRSPDASAAAAASPAASGSADPAGTPTSTVSPTGVDSPSGFPASISASGSPASATASPSAAPSGDPSDSATPSGSASDSPSPTVSASAVRSELATPARRTVVVKPARAKTKPVRKKRSVAATLMTAQLPSSGLPQR